MTENPKEILQTAYEKAKNQDVTEILSALSDDCVQELKVIVDSAESQKAVLGVVLTSVVYKIFKPKQDVRYHQENMRNGYSGRTFDTKYITPFLQNRFPHFAMAESAWLTRSLEQPFSYTLDYQGKIRNKTLKNAFLKILDRLETEKKTTPRILLSLLALMIEKIAEDESLFASSEVLGNLTIEKIVEAVGKHFRHKYQVSGAARLPVLAIYGVYKMLMSDVKRYEDRRLAPLESHTSPDSRSEALGDIEVLGKERTCFEAVEIKHQKPITAGTIGTVYRKIKEKPVSRYYILTTNEPNVDDASEVSEKLDEIRKIHSCQIIINGVLPSLKYYLRLVSEPEKFIDYYTQLLEAEYQRASGIKSEHLKVWNEIRQNLL